MDKVSIKTTGNGIENTIVEIFGRNVLKIQKVSFSMGYLGNASLYRATRDSIFTFVNGRMVKSKLLERYYWWVLYKAYERKISFCNFVPRDRS